MINAVLASRSYRQNRILLSNHYYTRERGQFRSGNDSLMATRARGMHTTMAGAFRGQEGEVIRNNFPAETMPTKSESGTFSGRLGGHNFLHSRPRAGSWATEARVERTE